MAIRYRNDPVRLFGRRLVLVSLLIGVGIAFWGAWGAYAKERESRALREQAEAQLHDLQERETRLDTDIANLRTDRGMEGVLREQYALAAAGEQLIVIVDPKKTEPIRTTSSVMEWVHKILPWW